ncbi:hypothetical protein BH20ACT15_BH20ACT15_10160 [soil metagenome]
MAVAMLGAGDAAAQRQPGLMTPKKAMWGPLERDGHSLFPRYRDLGVGIYQTAVRWDQVAAEPPADAEDPDDPAYTWPQYLDAAVEGAAANGMRAMVMLSGAPRWANGNGGWNWPAEDPADFADFAAAAARRYPSVNLWMIWGEPNRRPNFGPVVPAGFKGKLDGGQRRAPRIYARMLDAAYGALKSVSPANLVIGGNTYTSAGKGNIRPNQWARYMKLPGGARPRLDMWGHNPFSFKKPDLGARPSRGGAVTFSDLRRFARLIDRQKFRGRRHPRLYLAEWGVPIGFKDRDLLYSLEPKAGREWIRAALQITRRWKRIYTLGWIHPFDTAHNSQGLLNRDGHPKPGYSAYRKG